MQWWKWNKQPAEWLLKKCIVAALWHSLPLNKVFIVLFVWKNSFESLSVSIRSKNTVFRIRKNSANLLDIFWWHEVNKNKGFQRLWQPSFLQSLKIVLLPIVFCLVFGRVHRKQSAKIKGFLKVCNSHPSLRVFHVYKVYLILND